ncbi:MAG: membrane dipeptidase [Candidatus Methanosuratus sp.]|nr:membrane dipeptidase [Candidatus Methanosuratincola sp.]
MQLHNQAVVLDAHNHIMIELAYQRDRGEKAVFSRYYAPRIRQGGVNVIMMVVGGDSTSLTDRSDLFWWGSVRVMDMLLQEAEESSDTMAICLNSSDIDDALAAGKIAVLMTLEGARPLTGKLNMNSLAILRSFYRQGLRQFQLVDMGRNCVGDGHMEERTGSKLTRFGVDVVKECNRLGMIIDVAHLNGPGFWDVIEISEDPIVDTHSCARALCDHVRNRTDEQIKALAQNGGVLGLSAMRNYVSSRPTATIDDLIRHVDHVAELVGIDYVGLGLDHFEGEIWTDQGWDPAPGYMEGVYVGQSEGSAFVDGLEDITKFPAVTEALVRHGYSDTDIKKVLGENFLRVYRHVLG